MRILFAGSPEIALPSLRALSQMEMSGEGVGLTGILTNPDSKRGRSGNLEPTEVGAEAEALSKARALKCFPPLVCLKFEKLNTAARKEIVSLNADLLVSFAYGKIFGPKFLALFPKGGINIHPSLLPKYRGPTPIQAAILNREKETGVSIQKIALEMDTGDILSQEKIQLSGRETAEHLSKIASEKAAEMLPQVISGMISGNIQSKTQSGEAVYCSLITKEHGLISWNKTAEDIDSQVRAYTPWPLSFTVHVEKILYILEGKNLSDEAAAGKKAGTVIGIDREHGILIQTGKGVYAVTRLQWQAKKAMDWKSFLNGARNFTGAVLG